MADPDIEKVLLDEEQIRARVKELAAEACAAFEGRPILVVGVLKGAFIFLADLVREMHGPLKVAFLRAESYRDGTRPGELEVGCVGVPDLRGRDVLLVEDIVDTGRSLVGILDAVRELGALSVRTVVLLDKSDRREVDVAVDHVGFIVPDEFLVGYGLDHAEDYRNLPYVGVLARRVYEGS